jgi:hypothetical protein
VARFDQIDIIHSLLTPIRCAQIGSDAIARPRREVCLKLVDCQHFCASVKYIFLCTSVQEMVGNVSDLVRSNENDVLVKKILLRYSFLKLAVKNRFLP